VKHLLQKQRQALSDSAKLIAKSISFIFVITRQQDRKSK